MTKIESGHVEWKDAEGNSIKGLDFNEDLKYRLVSTTEDNKTMIERKCDQCNAPIPKDKAIIYCFECDYFQCETCVNLRKIIQNKKEKIEEEEMKSQSQTAKSFRSNKTMCLDLEVVSVAL